MPRRARPRGALLVAAAVVAVPLVIVGAASSDTANPPTTTKATVVGGSQTDVAPNGPLTGLADGTTVHITASGPQGQFFGVNTRICKPGLNIVLQAQFNPTQSGNCIDGPFSAQSDDYLEVSASPTNTSVAFDFRVGTGTRTFSVLGTSSSTVTCGVGNDCALWLKESVDTALVPSGAVWVHYDLHFGSGPVATTTTTPMTTTTADPSSATTTTVADSSGTTTTTTGEGASGTTTTTGDPSATTTTVAGGGTSSGGGDAGAGSSATGSGGAAGALARTGAAGALARTGAAIFHLLLSGWGLVVAGGLLLVADRRRRRRAR